MNGLIPAAPGWGANLKDGEFHEVAFWERKDDGTVVGIIFNPDKKGFSRYRPGVWAFVPAPESIRFGLRCSSKLPSAPSLLVPFGRILT